MIITVNKKKDVAAPMNSSAPLPASGDVVTSTAKKNMSFVAPTDALCNGSSSMIHLVATTTAMVGTSIIVGNIIHRLRPGSWILPAVVGAVSGTLASRIVGTTVNRWRGSHC